MLWMGIEVSNKKITFSWVVFFRLHLLNAFNFFLLTNKSHLLFFQKEVQVGMFYTVQFSQQQSEQFLSRALQMAVICLKDACGYMIVIVALLYSTRYIQYAIVIRLVNWHRIERRVIYVLCCYRRTETARKMIFMAEIQNSSTFLSTYPSLRFGLHTPIDTKQVGILLNCKNCQELGPRQR